MEEKLYVYFDDVNERLLIGNLYFEFINGQIKFSFEFSNDYLKSPISNIFLDCNLFKYKLRQYLPKNITQFGFLSDLSPDRWVRNLISKREYILSIKENRQKKD